MKARQVSVWMLTMMGRCCSVKRCSFLKLMALFVSAFLTWTIVVLMNASGVARVLRSSVYDDQLAQPSDLSALYDESDLAQEESLDGYFMRDNPLGTYFSERLRAYAASGGPGASNKKPLKKVLVLVRDTESSHVGVLGQFFEQLRLEYRIVSVDEDMPTLVLEPELPQYAVLVFGDYLSYLKMAPARRNVLEEYCKKYKVGILAFTLSKGKGYKLVTEFGLEMHHGYKLKQYKLNPRVEFWRVAKKEAVFDESLPSSDWTLFITKHETYRPLVYSTVDESVKSGTSEFGCVIAVHDQGLLDGIERLILGSDLTFWMNVIVAMDGLTHLTDGRLALPLDRLIQVDVDDMFVGQSGIRTLTQDAQEMLASQKRIGQYIPNFRYKLGYSGGMYAKGSDREIEGDRKIVELAENFDWFNHMYRHEQPHILNRSSFESSMESNINFAMENGMHVQSEYMVTPHHSGVFPVLDFVYDTWKEKGVLCTSTEQYPRPLPQWGRRGFIYKGIMVVPRQTCRLYTRTVKFENYPGGKAELDSSIRGGHLFNIILSTPVMIFMTHMSNYANDRVAIYAFERVFEFVLKWTNLRLLSPPPLEIARRYFAMYPQEMDPVWTNPCVFNKHLEIWPHNKTCNRLPKFIIVGPQKTGTTALLRFLEVHPLMKTSTPDPEHFEEIQFFGSNNYLKGIDWYQEHFPEPNDPRIWLFEKSANYFDSALTPKRVYALLPDAKIIVLVSDPAKRAYSWYYHLRSHSDPVAMNYTFFEVVSAPETSPRFLKATRNRCLQPGMYAVHLARWLQFFPKEQIYIIDADQLANDPVSVLHDLQGFLKVQPVLDYSTKLRYDKVKGFFCLKDSGCLNSNKGRVYPAMDLESHTVLQTFYRDHNNNLKTLFNDIKQPHPQWLINNID
ncbi:bifunctional heparan sulfate N-deacetylase/N-sulfotransferase 3-like [Physella acuta]|uniref:bifunctional heparan sulfate N-deacetylase/N-sulfotransferase 3-like n=1 Tax=Physella acuta TaxID=109671 RepID=UPI0027DBE40F|nr:bifunctional heparan sulfate N-deacetylase/N-sulfotransferase 3-like [Physella acuta]XP_059162379.1 bifunctional heparan sulfate N-deacetylase/N-sulfotransferase 3-like [Physella acuta]